MDRITRNEYYFKVVEAIALRATCDRGKNGAVIVKDGRIVATGYVGAPRGAPHCDEIGHKFEVRMPKETGCFADDTKQTLHCTNTVHAEINAIIQAARFGPSINGAKIYLKFFPCHKCAQAIINAGIISVHCIYDYHDSADIKALLIASRVAVFMEKPGEYAYESGDSNADNS